MTLPNDSEMEAIVGETERKAGAIATSGILRAIAILRNDLGMDAPDAVAAVKAAVLEHIEALESLANQRAA